MAEDGEGDIHYVPIGNTEGSGSDEERAPGVEVPHGELSADTLRGVVESFVNREGTDYGLSEKSLEQKVADVMRQLENGEAVIRFDPEDQSITIAPSSD